MAVAVYMASTEHCCPCEKRSEPVVRARGRDRVGVRVRVRVRGRGRGRVREEESEPRQLNVAETKQVCTLCTWYMKGLKYRQSKQGADPCA